MSECKCSLRGSLVGDGCSVCNPAQALEYAEERLADQALRIKELEKALRWTMKHGSAPNHVPSDVAHVFDSLMAR